MSQHQFRLLRLSWKVREDCERLNKKISLLEDLTIENDKYYFKEGEKKKSQNEIKLSVESFI